ncbi:MULTISPECIES: MBL fold metallo-hydrolase [Bacillaceae]|uniref:MBL fold metallo-hydrolase n=1 Tax=Evansella alkalicola TaxID=745819 RepID=A0ABS6JTS0_9BACI|nr:MULTISPECIES: MBL fold metallo-hydrolase [Bacillaceae]MBU9721893.1 MBL fold metallo-hydrolase [Bacillus alkalicola]
MKLTVIGFWGAYPEKNEATSCYLLQDGGTNVLLDCGSGAVAQLQNYIDLAVIDAVILSHYHHDHVADIGVLTYSRVVDMNLKNTDQPLHIYGHQDDQQGYQQLGKKTFAEAYDYGEKSVLSIGSLSFTFHPTSHPAPCYAIKVKSQSGTSIVYSADTSYDESLVPFIEGADLLITETSFYEGQEAKSYGHMNSKEAATLAVKGNVKELLLAHLPHFGDHQQLVNEAKKYFKGPISLGKRGLTWEE